MLLSSAAGNYEVRSSSGSISESAPLKEEKVLAGISCSVLFVTKLSRWNKEQRLMFVVFSKYKETTQTKV